MQAITRFEALGTLTFAAALLATGTAAADSDPPHIGGGSGIVIDDQVGCTLTTVGHDAADRLVGLTAGHCGEPGAAVSTEADPSRGTVGRIVYSDHRLDYAVIEFAPGAIAPTDRVGTAAIVEIGAPVNFPTVVCKKGRTTGTTCGVTWGDLVGPASDTWNQLCVLEGDSGAPVLVGATLVGMVNAYAGPGCLGPQIGTDIQAVVADLDARADIGAGFRPIRPDAVR
ncbi:serine protease [Nocardia takedensis]|uniref:serine protease n=1 Tax=Nocardia takedensis TaxID=259390 RepID=UPI0002D7E9A6|nr:serine protease [Nocardia takedensis]